MFKARCLSDETRNLVLIAISHIQLHVGSGSKFFALPHPHYAKWVDQNLLASIWKHTRQLNITVDVECHWTPQLMRENDTFIMEEIMKNNLTPKQMKLINLCRLYLQVLTIADIAAADGKSLLQSIYNGIQPKDRQSSLHWPRRSLLLNLLGTCGARHYCTYLLN
jgi:hypothetical protein